MPDNSKIQHRNSIRLSGYDYSQLGAYFVTICAKNKECLFGDIVAGEMRLNKAGQEAEQCWNNIPNHFPHAALGQFIIMPNHIHGIIFITSFVGANNYSPDHSPLQKGGTSKTIGSIVRGFKIGVTKWMRQNTTIHEVWQRNYWDHIIRNDTDLHRIRDYIKTNPAKWELDSLYPST